MSALATRLLLACALACAACVIDPFTFQPGGRDGGGDDDDDMDGGNDLDGGNRPDAATCLAVGVDDQCDGIDNDCNGVIDDAFDKLTDENNCGSCGNRCSAPNAVLSCEAGACVFVDCLPGFEDLDGSAPGCEYRCPVFPPQQEECNGIDEDCDNMIDEAADLAPPPMGLCRGTAGTPCAGTGMVCEKRGMVTTWWCDYDAAVEFDPSVPNGIFLEETLCDGLDGDCDGVADDKFTDLGQECDNGLLGNCRDVGARVCDVATPTQTTCDLSLPPAPIGMMAESCNGRDDDCDGVVDNASGPGRVVDDMVHVTHGGMDFHIYRYEASRPTATGSSAGSGGARACSRAGVMPWTLVTFDAAQAACAAAGKRLCTGAEWAAACEGSANTVFPYGNSYEAATCNGEDHDGLPGGVDDDVVLATGAMAMCTSAGGVFDLSGNVKEWTNDPRGNTGPPQNADIHAVRGGAFDTPSVGLACDFDLARAATPAVLATLGFRCCSDGPP